MKQSVLLILTITALGCGHRNFDDRFSLQLENNSSDCTNVDKYFISKIDNFNSDAKFVHTSKSVNKDINFNTKFSFKTKTYNLFNDTTFLNFYLTDIYNSFNQQNNLGSKDDFLEVIKSDTSYQKDFFSEMPKRYPGEPLLTTLKFLLQKDSFIAITVHIYPSFTFYDKDNFKILSLQESDNNYKGEVLQSGVNNFENAIEVKKYSNNIEPFKKDILDKINIAKTKFRFEITAVK